MRANFWAVTISCDRPVCLWVRRRIPLPIPLKFEPPGWPKKIAAGVEFIQTQCIYNLDKFELWMRQARDRGLHEKAFIMAGGDAFQVRGDGQIHEKTGFREWMSPMR